MSRSDRMDLRFWAYLTGSIVGAAALALTHKLPTWAGTIAFALIVSTLGVAYVSVAERMDDRRRFGR